MPVKQYTSLTKMIQDIADYIRRYKVEVFWDDNVNTEHYQLTTGLNTWAIARQHVVRAGQGGLDEERRIGEAMRTHTGKMVLLRTLNAMKNLPPPNPPTAWARLLDDD